jgi:acetoacetyl-CoA reductase
VAHADSGRPAAYYKVVAVYHGNDQVAERFKRDTGIPVYKWDVASYDACVAGLKRVEAEIGPIDILVNNAGITRDGMFHKMKLDQWNAVINTNLNSLFNMCRPLIEGMRERGFGRIIIFPRSMARRDRSVRRTMRPLRQPT